MIRYTFTADPDLFTVTIETEKQIQCARFEKLLL